MIVNCAAYEDGRRVGGDLSLAEAGRACRAPGAFVWLGVFEPEAAEFEEIATKFGLHELAVEDAIDAHQRPKIELYGDTLLVVVKTAHYVDSEEVIEIGELLIFVNADFIIVVRHGEGRLDGVRERIERRPDLLRHGSAMVLYAILDHVVDGYEEAAGGVDVNIQQVERQVFSADRYFRDVHDHLRRVGGRIAGFRELLGSALHANLTQISVQQNEDMRKITAWVAILAVPTMVAGIYGMNFDTMPELRWRFGYPTVVVLILIACALLHRRFHRDGWL